MGKIENFTDLETWKKAHELVLAIYKAVGKFPEREKFILSSQILRASISISSNIAEGFGRKGLKEKQQFYFVAQTSTVEVQNQLIIAKDVGYLDNLEFDNLWEKTVVIRKLLFGLIRSIKSS
ncbi:hypothetical protein A2125_02455 [Candidatus Woesebacteria bacterium GWB1_43_5]|uniref:Four helix bundle protein n=1 Tax=Candidatus Woesebacteria bacterium GWB1_43_5 TaxID=1802474 RepID=A0A1F7WT74_9BACT|nr:MAG: hypothetical protein A2125_02455 [Candidatus Woesebacteria bacterium GWB1_43_5]